jgi:hypothetical protein
MTNEISTQYYSRSLSELGLGGFMIWGIFSTHPIAIFASYRTAMGIEGADSASGMFHLYVSEFIDLTIHSESGPFAFIGAP